MFWVLRPSSGALDVGLQHMVFCTEFLDGWWSWEPLRRSCVRCAPDTCRAKNTLIKLPCCIKLAVQIISWGRCTVKQPSSFQLHLLIFLRNCIHLINDRKMEHIKATTLAPQSAVDLGFQYSLSPFRRSLAIACLFFLLPSIQSSSTWSLHLPGLSVPSSVAVAVCSGILSARPCHRSRTGGVNLKIMHPVVLNHKIKNKQPSNTSLWSIHTSTCFDPTRS